eukprot:TRINITY_DN25120_c0_g1_i1.p1 TRINITY_DN25120_c0_g1~~TRINITY_DN25120_c0_g1_i1.p1  ORF type:complete len:743 (-),score=158.47 TRINITY_DN25120_c0_g1_i1:68-2296(-)
MREEMSQHRSMASYGLGVYMKPRRKKGNEIGRCMDSVFPNRLAGWRCELDRDGDMSVSFNNFCKGVALLSKKTAFMFADLVEEFLALDADGNGELSFQEISPYGGGLVEEFRSWIMSSFEDPVEMFLAMDQEQLGYLDQQRFLDGCTRCGFYGQTFKVYGGEDDCFNPSLPPQIFQVGVEELEYLFQGMDFNSRGAIRVEEVVFLAANKEERVALLKHVKNHAQARLNGFKPTVVQRTTSPGAKCPWRVPSKAEDRKRAHERDQEVQRNACRSAADLKAFLYKRFGNLVRGWRRMNKGQNKRLSKSQVLRFCAEAGFKGNAREAYTGLDKNESGFLRLEDLDSLVAHEIQIVRNAMQTAFGSCEAACDKLLRPGGGWESCHGKLDLKAFSNMLTKGLGLQDGDSSKGRGRIKLQRLFESLDLYGLGFVRLPDDIRFLLGLEFADWVGKAGNLQAAESLRLMLSRQYGTIITAWCKLLDKDGSNEVTWNEFCKACEEIGFKNDVAGCWRTLDDDFSGCITLKELDEDSFDLLFSFKSWADEKFGSVLAAFEAMDADGSGTMNSAEFKTATRFYGWSGDAKQLFAALAPKKQGSTRMSTDDIAFLDQWIDQEAIFKARLQKAPPAKLTRPVTAMRWWSPARRNRCINVWGETWKERNGNWQEIQDPADMPPVRCPRKINKKPEFSATWSAGQLPRKSSSFTELPSRPHSATLLQRAYSSSQIAAAGKNKNRERCDATQALGATI